MNILKLSFMVVCIAALSVGCMTVPADGDGTVSASAIDFTGYAGAASRTVKVYIGPSSTSQPTLLNSTTASSSGTTWDGLTGYYWSINDEDVTGVDPTDVVCTGDTTATAWVKSTQTAGSSELDMDSLVPDWDDCWYGAGNEDWGDFNTYCVSTNTPAAEISLTGAGDICTCEEPSGASSCSGATPFWCQVYGNGNGHCISEVCTRRCFLGCANGIIADYSQQQCTGGAQWIAVNPRHHLRQQRRSDGLLLRVIFTRKEPQASGFRLSLLAPGVTLREAVLRDLGQL